MLLHDLIPAPRRVTPTSGECRLSCLKGIAAVSGAADCGRRLQDFAAAIELPLPLDEHGNVKLQITPGGAAEGWRMVVEPESVTLTGSDAAGLFYGVGALCQLLTLARCMDTAEDALPCGTVEDAPEFGWRGFLLDSARHVQSGTTIRRLLDALAEARINVLHWHLSDNQGWRIAAGSAEAAAGGIFSNAAFSAGELREITAYARNRHIAIVPELDMPGHSQWLLKAFPQYSCTPDAPGLEFCLGKPAGREFLKQLLTELAALFPDSTAIHLGGDETRLDHWRNCPDCQNALRRAGYTDFRLLERDFMLEMSRHVLSLGRRPIQWATEAAYPADTIIQCWQKFTELGKYGAAGNPVINSVHTGWYLDYPAHPGDPASDWMDIRLSEETLYQSTPFSYWGADVRAATLGCEACLWTEIVPEWRVLAKTLPRLAAYAEAAWCPSERKDYYDFTRRRLKLEAAGYRELIGGFCG